MKLIPYVIGCLLRGDQPKLSCGERKVDWVYVDDVVEALVAATHAKDIEGKTIDIGSGELISIKAIVERLVRMMGSEVSPQFGALADRPLEQQTVADVASTDALLNWKPRIAIAEGLKRTVDWYVGQFQKSTTLKIVRIAILLMASWCCPDLLDIPLFSA